MSNVIGQKWWVFPANRCHNITLHVFLISDQFFSKWPWTCLYPAPMTNFNLEGCFWGSSQHPNDHKRTRLWFNITEPWLLHPPSVQDIQIHEPSLKNIINSVKVPQKMWAHHQHNFCYPFFYIFFLCALDARAYMQSIVSRIRQDQLWSYSYHRGDSRTDICHRLNKNEHLEGVFVLGLH